MDSKNEFKKIDIKNCTCYYLDDITKTEDFYFGNILLDQKSCENILVNEISYKSFDKVDGFIAVFDENLP